MFEILPNWHHIFVHFTIALVTATLLFVLGARIVGESGRVAEMLTAGRWWACQLNLSGDKR